MVIRIALYSHDSVGLGHVRRNLAIAHALTESLPALIGEEVSGLLVSGQPSATSFLTPPGWDWLVLPGITTGVGDYASRHLTLGIDTMTAIRGNIVRVALREFAPDLVIVDRHALGARRELEAALTDLRARRPDCVIVLGLREVLDHPAVALEEWRALGGAATMRRLFDAVWVYGDPHIHDALHSGEIPPRIADLAVHTGYLAHGRPAGRTPRVTEPFVLTTVGGGSDGFLLAEAAARATVPRGFSHTVVTGPQMPDEHRRRIRAVARPGTGVVRVVPDAFALLRRASAVVCMAGYNSLSEVMSTSVPALVVPRVARRQEQQIRAGALARHGLIDSVLPDAVTPGLLSRWFARNVGRIVPRTGIDLDGLGALAGLAATLLDAKRASSENREVLRAV